jgi:hypothetical protein
MLKTASNPDGLPMEVFDGFRARRLPPTARSSSSISDRSFLRLQPADARRSPGRHPELVAAGHDGQRQGALRWHQGLLRDRPDRRPEGDHRPDSGLHGDDDQIVPINDAGYASVKLLKNGTLKVYAGLSARHADHPCRRDQRRPAGLHQGVNSSRLSRNTKIALAIRPGAASGRVMSRKARKAPAPDERAACSSSTSIAENAAVAIHTA